MKTFDNLKAGDRIFNEEDGIMKVGFYDFYATGEKIMCFVDKNSVWPAFQFYPEDWEKISK